MTDVHLTRKILRGDARFRAAATVAEHARAGMKVRQIAAATGLSGKQVWTLCVQFGISCGRAGKRAKPMPPAVGASPKAEPVRVVRHPAYGDCPVCDVEHRLDSGFLPPHKVLGPRAAGGVRVAVQCAGSGAYPTQNGATT